MTDLNVTEITDSCNQRLEGLTKHVSAKTEISVQRKRMKLSQVTEVYQAALDARSALKSARATVEVALQGWRVANTARSSLDRGLRAWIEATYGLDSQEARDMGFAPAKTGTKTVATKQQAALQAKATRDARHTMGKRQKENIKGVVVSPTAPAAPATNQGAVVAAVPSQPASSAAPVNGAVPVAATNGIASH